MSRCAICGRGIGHARECAMGISQDMGSTQTEQYDAPAPESPGRVLGALPSVALPWSCLVPDNAKYAPAKDRTGRAKIIVTERYREAKQKAEAKLKEQWGDRPPLEGPCAIRVAVYPPTEKATNDIANMTKLVHDALQGILLLNDRQLVDVHWTRESADIDRPRCEISVRPTP